MGKISWIFRLVLAALLVGGCSRKEDVVVAEVNGTVILAQEFTHRYERFLAQGGKRDNILLRQEVLNNMINEKLIREENTRRGFDSDDVYNRRMHIARIQALLDAYARKVSFDTIKITERELETEFTYFNTTASARYLYAASEEGAKLLRDRLQSGETFDALAREVFQDPGLANNGGYLGSFRWGEMEPALEEAAFTLPLGEISEPIKLKVGFAIVKPETRVHQALASQYDFAKARQKLADRIQEKKIGRLVRAAGEEASKEVNARFHDEAVDQVLKHWGVLFDNPMLNVEEGSPLPVSGTMKFMDFHNGTWTVADFVRKVEWTTEEQRRRVHSKDDVKDVAVGLATRDLLVERAKALGLDTDTAVQSQVESVRERYLLKRWSESITDTVGKSGWDQRVLDSVYAANEKWYVWPPEVNVAEILVRTEEEARQLHKKVMAGADFGALARTRSIRLWAAKHDGELGFGTQAMFGQMGERFFSARVGEIIGPSFVDPYWAVFKITGRKEARRKTPDEVRGDIVASLLPLRQRQAVHDAVSRLRSAASITIHTEELGNIEIRNEQNREG